MSLRSHVRTSLWFWTAWVLGLTVAVHVNWHLGRPLHMRFSLSWANHWIVGLLLGIALASYAVRVSGLHALRQFVLIGALGLVGGQVLEPLGEVLVYGSSLEAVYPDVRWRIFWQFTVAFVVGGGAVLIAQARRAQEATLAARHD